MHSSLAVPSHTRLQAAILRVLASAESEAAARRGTLDGALQSLAAALDPGFELLPGQELLRRLRSVETIVAALQAGALLRHTSKSDVETRVWDDGEEVESSELRAVARLVSVDAGAESAVTLARECRTAVDDAVSRLPTGFFRPILDEQEPGHLEAALREVDRVLRDEYRLRRRMLLERAQVTVRSLLWSDRLDDQERLDLEKQASDALAGAEEEPASVTPHAVRAVRLADVHAIMDAPTSTRAGGASGTKTAIKQVLIGAVPDRGGRVEGRAAPMPAWAARKATASGDAKGRPAQHRQKRLKKQH